MQKSGKPRFFSYFRQSLVKNSTKPRVLCNLSSKILSGIEDSLVFLHFLGWDAFKTGHLSRLGVSSGTGHLYQHHHRRHPSPVPMPKSPCMSMESHVKLLANLPKSSSSLGLDPAAAPPPLSQDRMQPHVASCGLEPGVTKRLVTSARPKGWGPCISMQQSDK